MKRSLIFTAIVVFLSSCSSFKEVGHVNMISNRNVDRSLDYKPLATYSGGSQKELKKSKATSVQEAVDQTVKKVPGGEFLMNVTIYVVNEKYFAVEGDVWGMFSDTKEVSYRGFKIGDKVTWEKYGNYLTGKITALKDDQKCLVEDEKTLKVVEMSYDQITKVQ